MRAWILAIVTGATVACTLVACAPTVDGPAEQARAADRADGARLATALHDLAGVLAVHPDLHHAVRDPFTNAETPPRALVLVLVDDAADRAAITATTERLVHAATPDVARPEILVEVFGHRTELARVGPFVVAARNKSALVGLLVGALAMIAALAGYIAWRARVAS